MTAPHVYVDPPDIPEGMTCEQYRATKERLPKRALLARLRRRPGAVEAAAAQTTALCR